MAKIPEKERSFKDICKESRLNMMLIQESKVREDKVLGTKGMLWKEENFIYREVIRSSRGLMILCNPMIICILYDRNILESQRYVHSHLNYKY